MSFLKRVLPLTLSMALLAGCGAAEPASVSPLDPDKPTHISVWTYYNGSQLSTFNALVDEFNATTGRDQGIFVESSSQGSVSDLANNVLDAVQGKVGANEIPNIFAAYADTAYQVDQLGWAADLAGYFTPEELSSYIDSYVDEGRFTADTLKIFPVAKSTELLLLNKTDWDVFAAATGAQYSDLSTMEGLTATAQNYYEWTDSLTPEPDDGRAFFGRDAMANYLLIGAMQLGTEIFSVQDGKMTLNFDRDTLRTLWDNYYVPYVKGYFASSGRFRSDDVKTGNILAFVGSSSGATFLPTEVILSDTEQYPIEMQALPCPQFASSSGYAVQQGAGMVVTNVSETEVYASVQFLKWFTQNQANIRFSVESGYLPVTKDSNDSQAIADVSTVDPVLQQVLGAAVDTVNGNTLYTPKPFAAGAAARSILEYAMSDQATADRATVVERMNNGATMENASAEFTTNACFDAWYESTLARLEPLAG